VVLFFINPGVGAVMHGVPVVVVAPGEEMDDSLSFAGGAPLVCAGVAASSFKWFSFSDKLCRKRDVSLTC
jgi:hypothetical protein